MKNATHNIKLQVINATNDLHFDFYFRGNNIKTKVYDETQFKFKHHMATPVKLDTTKMVISPMPGAIVEVKVQAGQTVVDG